jgi:hypothetical protein
MLRTTRSLPAAAAAIAAATAIAACGANSTSSTGSANSGGPPTQAQIQQDAIRFAECVRSHGVPNLPDPITSPRDYKNAFDTQSPVLLSADTACQHLLPRSSRPSQSAAQTRAQIAALLAFARCVRSHGFTSFPDPTSSGQVTHEMLANAGIDLHQPAVLQAADACVGVTHGLLTRAAVARFVAGR